MINFSMLSGKAPPRMQYQRNYLTQVIARADFIDPLPIEESGPPDTVYQAIKERFPISETRRLVARELHIGPDPVVEKSSEVVEWLYHGAQRDKYLKIGTSEALVSYGIYKTYEDLRADFMAVILPLMEEYPKSRVRRLGLRYINSIEMPSGMPTEWSDLLHPAAFQITSFADNKSTVSRFFHLLEFNYGNAAMRFQFGMPNPDYPAPIKRRQYVLDYDVYCELIIDRVDIGHALDEFHAKINASFEEVITDKLRELMQSAP